MTPNTTPTPFTFPDTLTPYNIPPAEYLSANPTLTNLVASAIILHNNRVLLVQRAPHDGFPLKWECPGGGVDLTDATVLHGLCREVMEETGLHVKHVTEAADILEFDGSKKTRWRKITFLIVLDAAELPIVQLDAQEHVDFVWATAEEVVMGESQGRKIQFAYGAQRQTVLDILGRTGSGDEDGVTQGV